MLEEMIQRKETEPEQITKMSHKQYTLIER